MDVGKSSLQAGQQLLPLLDSLSQLLSSHFTLLLKLLQTSCLQPEWARGSISKLLIHQRKNSSFTGSRKHFHLTSHERKQKCRALVGWYQPIRAQFWDVTSIAIPSMDLANMTMPFFVNFIAEFALILTIGHIVLYKLFLLVCVS